MSWVAEVLVLLFTCFVLVPTMMLFLEVMAWAFAAQEKQVTDRELNHISGIAVLVPAHNEEKGLATTLDDLRPQLKPSDRLIVIADNCTDDTANVARRAGAEVIERYNPAKLGKGYALDFGLRFVAINAPDLIIFIDADCRIEAGAISRLSNAADRTGRPVQALYLMQSPGDGNVSHEAAEFAWRIKNWIRPNGLRALRLPCHLMGTGMAFPWAVISKLNIATDNIVEDMKLGMELAAVGRPPAFCPEARLTSTFPTSPRASQNQRNRWEHGHIRLLVSQGPRYLSEAIRRPDLALFFLTLDLLIPPLGLLALLLISSLTFAGLGLLIGFSLFPLGIATLGLALFAAVISTCWVLRGRDILPLSKLPSAFTYLVSKSKLYWKFAIGRGVSTWIRTERD